MKTRACFRVDGVLSSEVVRTLAPDDQQARKVRRLLLGKGVVSAHRTERPFAARLDDDQQSSRGARRDRDARLR